MIKTTIQISDEIAKQLGFVRLNCLLTNVEVKESSNSFLDFSNAKLKEISDKLSISEIHNNIPLKNTRSVYKILGKDPSRYRPSAEALLRRVTQGKGLYHVNNVVDVLNLVSVKTGFSIGGYDLSKINGRIKLGIGRENEPYLAIGRGDLNIHNLPVLRDDTGAFGSPTSDSSRTMVTASTTKFLCIFFDFSAEINSMESSKLFEDWIREFELGEVVEKWQVTQSD